MPLLDFAAAWAEHQADPLVVRVDVLDLGEIEEHTLPGTMPAGLRLHMWDVKQRTGADADQALSYGDLQAAGRYLFGPETFERWLDARMTEEQLTDVVMTVLAVYASREAGQRGDEEPSSDGPAPKFGGPQDILANYATIEADFDREYGIDLATELPSMTWRRFAGHLSNLSPDSGWARLHRANGADEKVLDGAAALDYFRTVASRN